MLGLLECLLTLINNFCLCFLLGFVVGVGHSYDSLKFKDKGNNIPEYET